jgi:glycerol transport system substrate-binding protein
MDAHMTRLERANLPVCGPIMNEPQDAQFWLDQPGSPKPERPEEEPITVPYEELLEVWTGGE